MAESSGCQNIIVTSSMAPYPDIFSEDSTITDEIKYDTLKRPWTSIHSSDFPVRVISNSTRRAKAKWFLEHTWMKYSKTKDSVYCAPCRFFGPKSGTSKETTFSVTPVTDWSNITKLIQRHITMKSHETSLSAADDFLDVIEGKTKSVTRQISSHYDKIVTRNRQILRIIIETIIFCGQQNIAVRGHEEDKGNCMALLQYRSKDNDLLREHLVSRKLENIQSTNNTTYLSPEIQNEIIEICGEIISDDIVKTCNAAPCFGFMADETTDVATIEQMALCLRLYDPSELRIREEFIGVAECKATTGESLTESFLENLRAKGVIVNKMLSKSLTL